MKSFSVRIFIFLGALVAVFCIFKFKAKRAMPKEASPIVSLEEKAMAGDVGLMYELSMRNLKVSFSRLIGFSNNKNTGTAFYWAQRAYENGSLEAAGRLACFYEHGIGVESDLDKALDLYKKSAEAGNLEAKLRLSMFYTPRPKAKNRQKYADEEAAKALFADVLEAVNTRDDLDFNFYIYAINAYLEGNLCEKSIDKAVSIIERVLKKNESNTKFDTNLHNITNAMIFCYIRGIAVEKNEAKALEMYKKLRKSYSSGVDFRAYELGLMEGCSAKDYNALANDYKFSASGSFKSLYAGNEERAKELYKKAGDMAYNLAYYNLALIYFYDKDYETSFNLFNKSLEGISTHPEGDETNIFLYLAMSYEDGKGCEKNMAQALALYEKACDLGNTTAYHNLGLMYFEGKKIEKNHKKALEYMLNAKKVILSSRLYSAIAQCYEEQGDVDLALDSYKKALELVGKKAEKDIIKAKIEELSADAEGVVGDITDKAYLAEKDSESQVSLIEKAMAGDADAMYDLARSYILFESIHSTSYPAGIDATSSGFYWYKKAYENGNIKAIYHLARCYENGTGTLRDQKRALELYKEAWQKGDETALLHFVIRERVSPPVASSFGIFGDYKKESDMYLELVKVAREKDDLNPQVYEYVARKFIDKKDAEAINFLEKIYKNSEISNKSQSEIRDACIALAYCYATGTYTEKNEAKAIEIIKKLGDNITFINRINAYIFVANLVGVYELKTEKDFYFVATAYDPYYTISSYDSTLFVQDEDKAYEFYAKAELLGNLDAKIRIAHKAARDGEHKKAFDLYLEFVNDYKEYRGFVGGYNEALKYIAMAYEKGDIVKKDIEKSLEFYQKLATESNNASEKAFANAKLYYYGGLVEQSYEKALKSLLEGGSYIGSAGYEMIGEIYAKGLGTPKDLEKAISYYTTQLKITPSPKKEEIKALIKELKAELEAESKKE